MKISKENHKFIDNNYLKYHLISLSEKNSLFPTFATHCELYQFFKKTCKEEKFFKVQKSDTVISARIPFLERFHLLFAKRKWNYPNHFKIEDKAS